ncbi:MAG: EamA family transporter [Candidatus Woesearchaeota archaeon]|nr:EamA family transporter [Candidatus Woesearchaeota archaeon]
MEWYTLVILSSIFLTIQHVLQKKVLFREHATEYLTAFCLLMWIFLLPFYKQIQFMVSPTSFLLLYIIGLLSVFTWLPWVRAYRHMEISTVEPLRNLGPLIVVLFAALFLGEQIDSIHFLGIFLIIAGSYLLEVAVFRIPLWKPLQLLEKKYVTQIFLSMTVGSGVAVLVKIVLQSVNVPTFLFYTFFLASLHMIILQFVKYNGIYDIIKVVRADWLLLLLIVATTIISDYLHLLAIAMPLTLLSLAIPLRRLSTLFVTVIGGELFHENNLLKKTLACIIMLLGTYFLLL